jgi:hypothetical protein
MDRFLLKQDIVDKIKNDQVLYGQIAYLIGVTILSMRAVLNENSPKLTQASSLAHLKKYLGYENESDLLEVVTGDNNNTQEPQLQETH